MLYKRLQELGCCYGSIPVHGALYENSEKTKNDLVGRIFV